MIESSRRRFLKRVIAGAGVAAGPAVAAQPSPRVRAFDHVALPLQNVDAMIAFYRALGFEVEDNNPQVCVVRFGSNMDRCRS